MGYTPDETIYTVDFTGTHLAGLEVKVRSVDTDTILELMRLAAAFDDKKASDEKKIAAVDTLLTRFAGIIHSWNLEIPEGNPVPPTRENLGKRDFGRFVLPVLNMSIGAITDVPEELGKGSKNGARSLAALPMTAV